MCGIFRFALLVGFACWLADRDVHAADQGDAKLRENLRNTLVQLRTLQKERDTLQIEKTQWEQERQSLTKQVEAVTKQMAADKAETDKSIAELREHSAQQVLELAQTKEALEQSKVANKQLTETGEKIEGERAKLATKVVELERKVSEQRTKNLAMFKIGNEVLSRYEKFGLGTAIAAREPFTRNMRVKLENLVQDYEDKLAEQRIKPEPAPPRH